MGLTRRPLKASEEQAAVIKTEDRGEWRVLLIDGSSGTGKATIAQEIARRLSTSLLLVDDVRLALEEATTRAEQPELHAFRDYRRDQWRNSESIRDDWIKVGQAKRVTCSLRLAGFCRNMSWAAKDALK